jgi:hypothetical protein
MPQNAADSVTLPECPRGTKPLLVSIGIKDLAIEALQKFTPGVNIFSLVQITATIEV